MTKEALGNGTLNPRGTGKMLAQLMAVLVVLVAFPLHRAEGQTVVVEVDGDIKMNPVGFDGDLHPTGTLLNGIKWDDPDKPACFFAADLFRFGAIDDRLYVTNNACLNLTGVYLADGATTWTSTSDERLKFDAEPVTGILDKIRDIRVIEFNMAALGVDRHTGGVRVDFNRPARTQLGRPIKHEIGSVAQDWLLHFPQLVDVPKDDIGYYGLAYERIGILAIGAIQELEARVAELEKQLEEARK